MLEPSAFVFVIHGLNCILMVNCGCCWKAHRGINLRGMRPSTCSDRLLCPMSLMSHEDTQLSVSLCVFPCILSRFSVCTTLVSWWSLGKNNYLSRFWIRLDVFLGESCVWPTTQPKPPTQQQNHRFRIDKEVVHMIRFAIYIETEVIRKTEIINVNSCSLIWLSHCSILSQMFQCCLRVWCISPPFFQLPGEN